MIGPILRIAGLILGTAAILLPLPFGGAALADWRNQRCFEIRGLPGNHNCSDAEAVLKILAGSIAAGTALIVVSLIRRRRDG